MLKNEQRNWATKMSKTRFDLEQDIMTCWNVTDDLNMLYEYIGNDPFLASMSSEHTDKLLNLTLGLKELYQLKFDKMWKTFEECVANKEI